MAINMTDVIDSVDKNTDKIINSFRDYTDDGNPINPQLTIVINDNNRKEKLLYVENKNESGYSIVKKR